MPADLAARARRVRLLTCDVDGVLTDGSIYVAPDGGELKAYSSLDGLGMKWLVRSGVTVAWITGSDAPSVTQRAAMLGVSRVHQGAEDKLEVWERLRAELSLAAAQCAGRGAVRELCEMILAAQGKLEALLAGYGDEPGAETDARVRRL